MYYINYIPPILVAVIAFASTRKTKKKWRNWNLYEKIESVIKKIIVLWLFAFFLPYKNGKSGIQMVINNFSRMEVANCLLVMLIFDSAFQDYFKVKNRNIAETEKKNLFKKWVCLGIYFLLYILFTVTNIGEQLMAL